MNIVEIDESQSSLQFVSSEIDYKTLFEALNDKPSIEELHRLVPLDFIKSTRTGYTTIFHTEQGLVMVAFDANRVYSYARRICITECLLEETMERIVPGTSLDEVMLIDPNGSYPFLHAGSSQVSLFSEHFLENGIQYIVRYNENFIVTSVEKSMY